MSDPECSAGAEEQALFVAVELGGEWPSGFEASASVTRRRVLVQEEGEGPVAFAGRLTREIEEARSKGAALTVAAVACNERADESAMDARRQMGRSMLGAMVRPDDFRLEQKSESALRVYFTASARSSGRLRHALSSLASELGAEWASAGVETSVRFGDESRSAPSHGLIPARVA